MPVSDLSTVKAIVLGVVEGLTEFLPVSSTGHLHVAERLMHVGTASTEARDAANAYTVIIQIGAIAAVLRVSWRRVVEVFRGLVGRSATGKTLLVGLICGFVPAAVAGVLFDSVLERNLLKPIPVAFAWIVGGLAIFALTGRYRRAADAGRALETITAKDGLIIGCAQALALWPGTSRSLVTIVAAILLGFSLTAAVEFSFLLGLCTLGAACLYSLASDGSLVFDQYGYATPIVGLVVAFVAAAVAVKWMVGYLQRHDLRAFGAYRVAIGVATIGLVLAGTLKA